MKMNNKRCIVCGASITEKYRSVWCNPACWDIATSTRYTALKALDRLAIAPGELSYSERYFIGASPARWVEKCPEGWQLTAQGRMFIEELPEYIRKGIVKNATKPNRKSKGADEHAV